MGRSNSNEFYQPIFREPALTIGTSNKFLVISDLHVGYETLFSSFNIPSQTEKIMTHIVDLIKQTKPKVLTILGDVKHSVEKIFSREWQDIPRMFENLLNFVEVCIVPGNHDGDIEALLPRNVSIWPIKGKALRINSKKIGFFHGHTWPFPELLDVDVLLMGHNHPSIVFQDHLGRKHFEKVWIKLRWDKQKVQQIFQKNKKKKKDFVIGNPEIIILPAFNHLLRGISFNSQDSRFLGPLFRHSCLNIDDAEVFTLDGIFLGKIKNLIE